MTEVCERCVYCKPGAGSLGECHRNAPLAVPGTGGPGTLVLWPKVNMARDFCGEFSQLIEEDRG